jgi:hypothetical protein
MLRGTVNRSRHHNIMETGHADSCIPLRELGYPSRLSYDRNAYETPLKQRCSFNKAGNMAKSRVTSERMPPSHISIVQLMVHYFVSMTILAPVALFLFVPCHIGGFGPNIAFIGRRDSRRSSFFYGLNCFPSDGAVESVATLRSVTFSRLPRGEGALGH